MAVWPQQIGKMSAVVCNAVAQVATCLMLQLLLLSQYYQVMWRMLTKIVTVTCGVAHSAEFSGQPG